MWSIFWPDKVSAAKHLSLRERMLPRPGPPVSMDTLRVYGTRRIMASFIMAWPIGIIRGNAYPAEGKPRAHGPPALHVGGMHTPLLSDVEVGAYLGLPDGPLPEELRLSLDRMGEGQLALFRQLAHLAIKLRNRATSMVVRLHEFPGSQAYATPLARLGEDVKALLLRAFLSDVDPETRIDVLRPTDKRPAGYYTEVYAAVARAVANPTSGQPFAVEQVLRFSGTHRREALIAAVGAELANQPGLFRLEEADTLPRAALDGTFQRLWTDSDEDEAITPENFSQFAHSVDRLRLVCAAQVEALSALRHEALGAVDVLAGRMARLEFRCPGDMPLAMVDDIDAYRAAVHEDMGAVINQRMSWCEQTIASALQIAVPPPAPVAVWAARAAQHVHAHAAGAQQRSPDAEAPGGGP